MGCGSTKAAQVVKEMQHPSSAPLPLPKTNSEPLMPRRSESTDTAAAINVFNVGLKSNSGQHSRTIGIFPQNLITADDADREGSGKSRKSRDSGIGSAGAGRLLESSLDKKRSAELLLQKQPSPPLRIDSTKIMESLRKEGLLGDPKTSTKTGGVCFEIALDELKVRSKRPPAQLQKIDRATALKMTNEKIVNKLKNAELRRKKRMQATIARSKERDAKSFETKLKLLELEKKKEQQLKETLCQIQQQKQAQLDAASKGLGLGNEVQEKKLQNGVLTNPTENKILNPVLKNVDDVPVGPAAVASRASAQNKTRLFSPKQKK